MCGANYGLTIRRPPQILCQFESPIKIFSSDLQNLFGGQVYSGNTQKAKQADTHFG